jgi:hypothetical protein
MSTTYSEKLKLPQWQRRRLEILQRDNFTCKSCQDTQTELHVHHKRYIPGKDAWEAEDNDLETLCKFCHQVITRLHKVYKEYEILSIRTPPVTPDRGDFTFLATAYEKETGKYFLWVFNAKKSDSSFNFSMTIQESTIGVCLEEIQTHKSNGK